MLQSETSQEVTDLTITDELCLISMCSNVVLSFMEQVNFMDSEFKHSCI